MAESIVNLKYDLEYDLEYDLDITIFFINKIEMVKLLTLK